MTATRSRSQRVCTAVALAARRAPAGIRRAIVPSALRLHGDDRVRQPRHRRASGPAGASPLPASAVGQLRRAVLCAAGARAAAARSGDRSRARSAAVSRAPDSLQLDRVGLGLGRPQWILHAYALQNVFFWLVLAVVMTRWLRPDTPRGLALWIACLFSHGLLTSVRSALLDGPSMLLIALAIAASERGRLFTSAAIVGVAGLGRETNLLAVARPAAARPSMAMAEAWIRGPGACGAAAPPLAGLPALDLSIDERGRTRPARPPRHRVPPGAPADPRQSPRSRRVASRGAQAWRDRLPDRADGLPPLPPGVRHPRGGASLWPTRC